MSQEADLKAIFRQAIDRYGLSERECAELFLSVTGALEWDIYEINIEDEEWEENEILAAIKDLF
jgi:hypothetical protein